MGRTAGVNGILRGSCPRGLPLSLFFALFSCSLPWLVALTPGEGAEPQTAPECTVDADATVVFEAGDTEKQFKCPTGWKLKPDDANSAFQGSDSTANLAAIFSGATREDSETVFTLTLPAGGTRKKTTWYYKCEDVANSDEPPTGGSTSVPNGSVNPGGSSSSGTGSPGAGTPVDPETSGNDGGAGPSDPAAPPGGGGGGGGSGADGSGSDSHDGSKPGEDGPDGGVVPSLPEAGSVLSAPADPQSGDGLEAGEDKKEPGRVTSNEAAGERNHQLQETPVQEDPAPPAFKTRGAAYGLAARRGARQEKRKTCRITVEVVPSTVIQCISGGTEAANVAAAGEQVVFKCGEGLTLRPGDLGQVYDDKDGKCASQVALTSLVQGALSDLTSKSDDAPAKDPSYVLRVDELPVEQQALCYRCVGSPRDSKTADSSTNSPKECMVKIRVSPAASSQSPAVILPLWWAITTVFSFRAF